MNTKYKVSVRGNISKRLQKVLDVMADSASKPSQPYVVTKTAGRVVIHRLDKAVTPSARQEEERVGQLRQSEGSRPTVAAQ